jgi:GTP-binding protein EngB required for normal cell division
MALGDSIEAVEMNNSRDQTDLLNENHKRHLLVTCQYVDKLLSDIEQILNAASSTSPFPKYRADSSPVQRKVAQDYISRIRAQLVRVLEGQRIARPRPQTSSIFAIRTILGFVDIALEELKPRYMRGYGEVSEAAIPELNGISGELQALARELDLYLAQGLGQNLEGRLERLAQTGDEAGLLRLIERVVADHGLVEFRAPLLVIIERLEEQRFEIAFFGRVSAGKSSLLNHILQSEALPVGVNPITAIPTRIIYGPAPRLTVWFANNEMRTYGVERLAEFVTEQHNAANAKHVTRLSLELPSDRLRDGIALVDTPGLGSLASAGSAETLAYLPRCDLGVVLIDAGSTLTQEDLGTIRALYEATVPVLVLLSKADLLTPEDRARALEYIEGYISSQLGLDLKARPVSTVGAHAELLERWFAEAIAPLYERHRQLAAESIKRKIGALKEAVEATLRLKIERKAERPQDRERLAEVEAGLRHVAGKIEEARSKCWDALSALADLTGEALRRAAVEVASAWPVIANDQAALEALVGSTLAQVVAEKSKPICELLDGLGHQGTSALHAAARELGAGKALAEAELNASVKEMPRFDPGALKLDLRFRFLLSFGSGIARHRVEQELRRQIGPVLTHALSSYQKVLEAWALRALNDVQQRFAAQAGWYRAQIQRLAGESNIAAMDEERVRRDLEALARWRAEALTDYSGRGQQDIAAGW